MRTSELFRSILYIPGSNTKALEKAKGLDCDGLIFDLEDAVIPEKKDEARVAVKKYLTGNRQTYGNKKIIVRVNSCDTVWGEEDFISAVDMAPDAILLPKISSADDFDKYLSMLKHDLNPDIKVWAMIESAASIVNIKDIATATKNLEGFVMGTNDLAKELNISNAADRQAIGTALSITNIVAKAHSLICVDGVYNRFRDLLGFEEECKQGKRFGFDGKTIIHPSQIKVANIAFSPSTEEIENARMQVDAFYEAKRSGSGIAVLDGKIVENLHVKMAQDLLSRAKLIAEKQS